MYETIIKTWGAGATVEEVARWASCCRQTIYNEINAGRLKSFTIGRKRLISPQSAIEWHKALIQASNGEVCK